MGLKSGDGDSDCVVSGLKEDGNVLEIASASVTDISPHW
jgi:hypothetical protein